MFSYRKNEYFNAGKIAKLTDNQKIKHLNFTKNDSTL